MPQAMPMNCEADDELREVRFDLEFEGVIRKVSISYDELARLFTPPRQGASPAEVRGSLQTLVCHSRQVARLAIERLREQATSAAPIATS